MKIKTPEKITYDLNSMVFFGNLLIELKKTKNEIKIIQLSFKETTFIDYRIFPVLALLIYECKLKNKKVIFRDMSFNMRQYFNKKENLIPCRFFLPSNIEEFENYVKNEFLRMHVDSNTEYIVGYLIRTFQILDDVLFAGGGWNQNKNWLFFTMTARKVMELDDWFWHFLIEELKLLGGFLRVIQGDLYYNLSETVTLDTYFEGTVVIIGFKIPSTPSPSRI